MMGNGTNLRAPGCQGSGRVDSGMIAKTWSRELRWSDAGCRLGMWKKATNEGAAMDGGLLNIYLLVDEQAARPPVVLALEPHKSKPLVYHHLPQHVSVRY